MIIVEFELLTFQSGDNIREAVRNVSLGLAREMRRCNNEWDNNEWRYVCYIVLTFFHIRMATLVEC